MTHRCIYTPGGRGMISGGRWEGYELHTAIFEILALEDLII